MLALRQLGRSLRPKAVIKLTRASAQEQIKPQENFKKRTGGTDSYNDEQEVKIT